ncbi:MAG: zinc ribbon domain-containing protein [Ruminococcus sp.]|nr:zinc ribbon domain-containing protein [Ruminococcus sp.]
MPQIQKSGSYPTYIHKSDRGATWSECGDTDKYAGYIYCAECGSKMYLHRGKGIKPENNYYQCGGYQTKGGRYCTVHRIKANVLDSLVLKQLRDMTAYVRDDPEEFYEIAARNGRETAELTELSTELDSLERRDECIREFIENARQTSRSRRSLRRYLKRS